MFRTSYAIRVSVLFPAIVGALQGAAPAASDQWLETRMGGQPAGYVHEQTLPSADGSVSSILDSKIVLNRLGSKVEIDENVREQQSAGGNLLAVHSELRSSMQSTVTEARVETGKLLLHLSTGGKSYDRELPFTGVLLGQEGARRRTLESLHAPGDTVSYEVFSSELGTISTMTRTYVTREDGGLRIEESMTGLPGKATVWLDGEARTLRRSQPGPFGEIEIRRTSQDVALAATSGANLPPEAFNQSLVRSNIRLPHERLIESLRIRVTHKKPELGWPDFAGENQTVLSKSANSMVLELRRPELAGHGQRPAAPDAKLKPFLDANALFQSDDADVQAIAHKIVGSDSDAFSAALKLRDWTSQNVRFDPGIAIAPASEVVRDRAGTCFGYSILLGSLARAAGIPSRIKMGFVYTGGIWGGHAWIEVFVDGRWIPIDAALPSPGEADAARLSFLTSSLEAGTISDVGNLAQLFGNVEIQILSYTVNGKTVMVPEHAPGFTVEGNMYKNPWLGIKVVKPEGYCFKGVGLTWPEPAILALEGPHHESVELEQLSYEPGKTAQAHALEYLQKQGISGSRKSLSLHGRAAFEIEADGKAALVVPESEEMWVMIAHAPNPGAVLDIAMRGLELPAFAGGTR